MTKQVLFIQGGGGGTHDEWDNKLVASLGEHLGPDYDVRYPRMPNEAEPAYETWKTAILQAIAELPADSILVGHSLGGMFLVSLLAEEEPPQSIAGVFLVATLFIGPGGWPSDDFEAQTNLGSSLPTGLPVYLYHGSEDETAPVAHVDLYQHSIPYAQVRKLPVRDHQLNNDLSEVAADILALD